MGLIRGPEGVSGWTGRARFRARSGLNVGKWVNGDFGGRGGRDQRFEWAEPRASVRKVQPPLICRAVGCGPSNKLRRRITLDGLALGAGGARDLVTAQGGKS